MSEWYDYMIRASKYAKDDEHWIRYLYKVIDYRWIRLTDEDYENLMKSEELSSDQKSILKEAMTEGTDLRNHEEIFNYIDSKIVSVQNARKMIEKAFELEEGLI